MSKANRKIITNNKHFVVARCDCGAVAYSDFEPVEVRHFHECPVCNLSLKRDYIAKGGEIIDLA